MMTVNLTGLVLAPDTLDTLLAWQIHAYSAGSVSALICSHLMARKGKLTCSKPPLRPPRRIRTQVPVAILTVIPEDDPNPAASLHLQPASIAVILEGNVVLDDLFSYPEAFCLLLGLMYALHLDYPKSMKYSFEFIQKILLGLGQDKLCPKLQSLKNAVMSGII